MKDMRLFEIGFKMRPHSAGYVEKFYVVANGGEDAVGKARKWLEQDHCRWWKEEGRDNTLWEMADKDFQKSGLDDEQYDEWLKENNTYSDALTASFEKAIEEIAKYELAKLYDVGTVVV